MIQSQQDRARKRSKDVIITDDLDTFLGSDIDVVAVCSPDTAHADHIVRSLQANKHVICEKPLTDSIEGCRKIIQAERQAPQCTLAVQHQMRFLPVHIKMKQLIQRGELGKISYIEGYYVHNLTKRASLYDNWRFVDKATPLVYSGCHFVDLLRWLLDDEVDEVMGMANNIAFPEYPESDLNVVLLRFRSGTIGKVITAFGAGRPQDHSVRVYGSEKCIENNLLFDKTGRFTVFARPFLEHGSRKGLTLRQKIGTFRYRYYYQMSSVLLGLMFEGLMKLCHSEGIYSVGRYPIRLYEHNFAMRASICDFINSIHGKKGPLCTSVDAAKTVATCLAGVEAYRTGKKVLVEKYWIPEFKEPEKTI
jgi:predicted dehydrogenase